MSEAAITSTTVPTEKMSDAAEKAFGMGFSFSVEPYIFSMAQKLSENSANGDKAIGYTGGCWKFHQLSNGGFYMTPDTDKKFNLVCDAYQNGKSVSAETMGIIACLYAYSHRSFGEGKAAEQCGEMYHKLREYAYNHPDQGIIFKAID